MTCTQARLLLQLQIMLDGHQPVILSMQDSHPAGQHQNGIFGWMLRPCTPQQFNAEHLDRQPLLIKRKQHRNYYNNLLSKSSIQQLLRTQQLQYGLNVDVTRYTDSHRINLNYNTDESQDGMHEVASAAIVMKRFKKGGCSVRILHPQRWVGEVHRLLSRLEHELRSPVGCNAYLTPPGSQGFAPHWDDIDAFVLQLEGSKRWCLYAPQDPADLLPLHSSPDFSEDELGELLLDVVLHPGDMLYMPRGCIHHAEALPKSHSLHLTVSANQHSTWSDVLQLALPRALQIATSEHVELRQSIPVDVSTHMGLAHEDKQSKRRSELECTAQRLAREVLAALPLDAAADQMAIKFTQQRLPPYEIDQLRPDGMSLPQLDEDSEIYLVKAGIAAMAVEDDVIGFYHCLNNASLLHAAAPESDSNDEAKGESSGDAEDELKVLHHDSRLEFELDEGPLLERIMCTSPSSKVSVRELMQVNQDAGSRADVYVFLSLLWEAEVMVVDT